MSAKIRLLDCTLRDGAYVVDARFGTAAIRGIIHKLEEAGAEIIECGWLKDLPHEEGTSFYHVPRDLAPYLGRKRSGVIYAAMIDWDRYDLETLPFCDGETVDAIRVVFPHGKQREAMAVGARVKEKGYALFLQAANTLAYSDGELAALAEEVNALKPCGLSVVDTFGAMYASELDRIVRVLDGRLLPEIQLGFHSHNNLQLSFSLTMHFVEQMRESGRDAVVDASLCGMGRGAGNAPTELVAAYMNRACGAHYDMDAVMDAIDVYMEYFKKHYTWGYSTPYMIAGLYGCHVNNVAYLMESHRTGAKEMRNIIESLSPADRRRYDYALLEQKYLENCDHDLDDRHAAKELSQALQGKAVLLVAPGRSAVREKDRVDRYIEKKHPVVIGVNAVVADYPYDYLFFANPARYEYAKESHPTIFFGTRRILLSSCRAEGESLVFGLNAVAKRGWRHFDNGMICALRLLDRLGVEEVSVVGFDGFRESYAQSYADPLLPALRVDGTWRELNDEIRSMLEDFRATASALHRITFLTESLFEAEEGAE